MLDVDKCKEILENYFANVTQEQFAIDLEKYCPELFEAERKSIDDSYLVVPPILVRVASLEENRYQPKIP